MTLNGFRFIYPLEEKKTSKWITNELFMYALHRDLHLPLILVRKVTPFHSCIHNVYGRISTELAK